VSQYKLPVKHTLERCVVNKKSQPLLTPANFWLERNSYSNEFLGYYAYKST